VSPFQLPGGKASANRLPRSDTTAPCELVANECKLRRAPAAARRRPATHAPKACKLTRVLRQPSAPA
jgi:hypothetical protein